MSRKLCSFIVVCTSITEAISQRKPGIVSPVDAIRCLSVCYLADWTTWYFVRRDTDISKTQAKTAFSLVGRCKVFYFCQPHCELRTVGVVSECQDQSAGSRISEYPNDPTFALRKDSPSGKIISQSSVLSTIGWTVSIVTCHITYHFFIFVPEQRLNRHIMPTWVQFLTET